MMQTDNSQTALFVKPNKVNLWILVTILLLVGFAVRFFDFIDLPLDFAATRQLHSLLMARGIYYKMDLAQTNALDPDIQRIGIIAGEGQPAIEPSIMEHFAAYTYALLGREWPNAGRFFSILFWVIGGIPLFLLTRRLISVNGALAALAFYLFVPFGVYASRSFQPDPLMVSCILWAIYFQYKWFKNSTLKNSIMAGLLTGLAVFVKAPSVFFVGLPLLSMVLMKGFKNWVKDWQVFLMAALALVPALIFIIINIAKGNEGSIFGSRFFPALFIDPSWYHHWFTMAKSIVGYFPLFLAILAFFLIRQKDFRIIYLSLWMGYIIFGYTFAYHIYTHNYYSLPLVFIVAVGFGIIFDVIFQKLESLELSKLFRVLVVLILFAGVALAALVTRNNLQLASYRHEAAYWKALGEKIGVNKQVIGLTHDYGYRLQYWGFVLPKDWPTRGDMVVSELGGKTTPDFVEYFNSATNDMDYFLVTLIGDFEAQTDLHDYLFANYPYEQGDGYYLFDLRHPLETGN
jgi:hypothetical protein